MTAEISPVPEAGAAPPGDTRLLGRELIDTLGRGWARGKLDVIMSVFGADATLVETPFSEPLRGIEAVRGYWKDVPYHQTEVTFSSGEIFAAGPWFSTEFLLRFRRRRTGEWIEARGALFCETDGALITEMRMYWHRESRGRT